MYKQKYDESFYSYFPSMIEDSSETHNRFLDQELNFLQNSIALLSFYLNEDGQKMFCDVILKAPEEAVKNK